MFLILRIFLIAENEVTPPHFTEHPACVSCLLRKGQHKFASRVLRFREPFLDVIRVQHTLQLFGGPSHGPENVRRVGERNSRFPWKGSEDERGASRKFLRTSFETAAIPYIFLVVWYFSITCSYVEKL